MKSIEILEKLDREATKGPWVAHHAAVGFESRYESFFQLTHQYGSYQSADAKLIPTLRNCLPEIIELVRAAETTEKARSQDAVFHAVGKLRHSLLALERKVSGES